MEYQEVMQRLEEMKSRYNDGFSSKDRSYLESLHYTLFGKTISNKGCSDCYRDAYMLILVKLKKEKAMPKSSSYKLKPGAIIQFFGESKVYANNTLTDEVAERYLSLNVDNIAMFAEYPNDWEERVAKYVASASVDETEVPTTEILLKDIFDLKQKNEELVSINAELTESLEAANAEIETMKSGVQTVADNSEELEALKQENASLKNEVKSLKAANTRLKNKYEKTDSQENDTNEEKDVEPTENVE